MGNIRLERDDQPTREELLKIRGKDLKPVPTKARRAEKRVPKR
jgi:hypothetical protein